MPDGYAVDRRFLFVSAVGLGVQLLAWSIVFLTWLYPLEMNHWMQPLGMDPSRMNHWILSTGGMIAAPGMSFVAAIGLLIVLIGLVGIVLMSSHRANAVRYGGLLLILVALIAYPSVWGFFLGSALMILGGAGGLGKLLSERSQGRP